MNTSSGKTKNKSHPWRTYGVPISNQWSASHEPVKPTVEKILIDKSKYIKKD